MNRLPRCAEGRLGLSGILLAVLLLPSGASAQQWSLVEDTFVQGTVSGTVMMGHVFSTVSGNYYEVISPTVEVVVEVMPRMTVLSDGRMYRLIVQGFRDDMYAVRLIPSRDAERRLPSVIESRIDGDFEGYEHGRVYRLRNGQYWEQTSSDYRYRYAYAPETMLVRRTSGFEMRVDRMDRWVRVRLLQADLPEGSNQ